MVAGGGIAGLEELLALHAGAGERVRLTLISPEPEFVYWPMTVGEPFAAARAYRVPLTAAAADTGARLITERVEESTTRAGRCGWTAATRPHSWRAEIRARADRDQSMPSTMRKSRSTPSARAASASW
jgi:sulfide:quinone oxidoreductase